MEQGAPVLYEDTRQQAGKHSVKHTWWEHHGVTLVRKKLDFGDYMTDGSNISIDTKKGLKELSMDCGRDHDRFVRELDRAARAGYRLVILVEQSGGYETAEDVAARWINPVCTRCIHYRTQVCHIFDRRCLRFRCRPMQGETLAKQMAALAENHGCRFELVHPSRAARRICEILGVAHDG